MENFDIQTNKINSNNSKYIQEETKLINRKDLFRSGMELEQLQEEFIKTSNEKNISVKVVKMKENVKEKISLSENLPTKENSASLKKKKDFIKMDLNMELGENFKENKSVSIFKFAIENQSEFGDIKFKSINKDTGLPETFKVDLEKIKLEKASNALKKDKIKTEKVNSKEMFLSKLSSSSAQIENTEYKNIHDTNISAITKMTKDELIQYQQMIKAKIPDKLREKMSSGYFQKKIRDESNKLNLKEEDLNVDNKSAINMNENMENKAVVEEENLNTKNLEIENQSSNVSNASNMFTLHINYNGEFFLNEDKDPTGKNKTIDYSIYKLSEVDLDKKYFSINEVYNLLASSSEPQIVIGLKLSVYLVDFYFEQDGTDENILKKINQSNFEIKNPSILIKDLRKHIADLSLWNVFYNLMEYKNIHIKFLALQGFTNFVWNSFKDNFKMFKANVFKFANFPGIKLFHNNNEKENNSSVNYLSIVESFNLNSNKNLIYLKNSFLYFQTISLHKQDDLNKIEENLSNTMKFLFFCFYFSEDFATAYFKSELDSLLMNFLQSRNDLLSKANSSAIRNIVKKVFVEIFLQATSVEVLKSYQKIFEENNLEYLSLDQNLNFLLIIRGVTTLDKKKYLTNDKSFSFKNIFNSQSPVAYNILIKLVNEKNLELFTDNSDFNQISVDNIRKMNLSKSGDKNDKKDLLMLSKFLQLKIKLCKYSVYAESQEGENGDEFCILSTKIELDFIQELFIKSIMDAEEMFQNFSNANFFPSAPLLIDINILFEFWNTVLTFYQFSNQNPRSIKYMNTLDSKNFEKLFQIAIKITKYFSVVIENFSQSQPNRSEEGKPSSVTSKIQYLYKIENFTKFLLNFLKYFSQPHLELRDEILNLFFTFACFLNTNCECYYNRFIKYLELIFYKKSTELKIQNFLNLINFSFEELCVDLNLYLGSNEDLRKSTMMKKNLYLEESLTNLIYKSNNSELIKSKFLPFNKNFILQILYNNKIKSELKLNYMTLLIVLFHNQNSQFQNINFFEIILKILNNYSDEINRNKDEIIFSEFIKNLILFQGSKNFSNIKEISLNKTFDNEIQFEIFFDKFDLSNLNQSELKFYYKFIFVFIIMFHSNKKLRQNFKIDKLNLIIYSNFMSILDESGIKSLSFFDVDSKKVFVDFIIDNLSMQNVEFYEVCIMSYFKFLINNEKFLSGLREDNVFVYLIEALLKRFKLLDDNEDDRAKSINRIYHDYLEDNKKFRNKLEKELL